MEHLIEVFDDTIPIKQRHYPMSPIKKKYAYDEIDRMLKLDVIEESNSSWSSPIVLVEKPGKKRLCVDMRKLNESTKRDAYPTQHVEGILSRLRETYFISGIDLKDAFWQIPLESSSREKTAFTVPGRPLYQFKVMPFGLCNASQRLCRLMDKVISSRLREHVFVYIDDLLICSPDFDSHLVHLAEVAECLAGAGLTINLE
ncbi:PREDICTED: RNA-directed DNA polymerase homolog [Rhagoletis zephyria]|uniref:RNA-directed DNA polymerase homolog n=1 Tax=Rhagoletis zephyria TaxID=28612 RepID=UPI0008114B84|nr:PREDICTED: RNA-directed DNA polymerase homolog [Rhagoletis zephyria]